MSVQEELYIKILRKETTRFLSEILPSIGGDNWWNDLVKEQLTHGQRRIVESKKQTTLKELDLQKLMRVFDKNWDAIQVKMDYPYDNRNLVKEIKEIRNFPSHVSEAISEAGRPLEDLYRELDTTVRYLTIIGSETENIKIIDDQRIRIMKAMAGADKIPNKLSTPEPQDLEPENKKDSGIDLDIFVKGAVLKDEIRNLLAEKTFIGIDFGTSTTVASYIRYDEENKMLVAEPIPIKQYDELDRCIEDHLVPTCIAWTGQELLVGSGAVQLKSSYDDGKNIWSSFKMLLGAQSVIYFRSSLSQDKGSVVIETPQQAATVFFQYLRQQIEIFILEKNLPEQVLYSVSVPASFEANQRKDLLAAIMEAGLKLPIYGIIDEPNAAFISYLIEMLHTGSEFSNSLTKRKRRILIFDFGAGTCDISILEVGKEKGLFTSRNLAISQFKALGGDNIDRQIARESLLKQMIDQMNIKKDFTTNELKELIIPKLQPIAEGLKIQICKYLMNNWDGKNVQPFVESDKIVSSPDVKTFRVSEGFKLKLEKPSLSFSDFAQIMEPFLTSDESEWSYIHRKEDVVSIFEPLLSALEKAAIDKDNLDMILLIGGSSLNPFVQSSINNYFGRFVESVALSDLRTPVSKGVAFYSFIVNGLNCEIIKPITSETIYVLTLNCGLRELLPAGTDIPSEEFFIEDLEVQRDGQLKLELPICVTSEDKILQVLEIFPGKDKPFVQGEKITLSCCMDENKLLQVKAKVGTRKIKVTQLNPLANKELSPEDKKMLQAQQNLYSSMLNNKGRPTAKAMLNYAYAFQEAKKFVEAAEAYEALERLDPNRDFSTTITYLYSEGDKPHLSSKWSTIAYERQPNEITAFNLALSKMNEGDIDAYESLMETSLEYNPDCEVTLEAYGNYLKKKDSNKGLEMIEKAFESFKIQFDKKVLDEDDIFRLRRASQTLGRIDVLEQIDNWEKNLHCGENIYSDKYLAKSTESNRERKRRE